jgi:hypothetical protein
MRPVVHICLSVIPPPSYEFGTFAAATFTPALRGSSAMSFSFGGLPEGTSTLYVCVTDNAGGTFCDPHTVNVTVTVNNAFNLTAVSQHHISHWLHPLCSRIWPVCLPET